MFQKIEYQATDNILKSVAKSYKVKGLMLFSFSLSKVSHNLAPLPNITVTNTIKKYYNFNNTFWYK